MKEQTRENPKDNELQLHVGTSDEVETEDAFLAAIARHTEGIELQPPVANRENIHRVRYR